MQSRIVGGYFKRPALGEQSAEGRVVRYESDSGVPS